MEKPTKKYNLQELQESTFENFDWSINLPQYVPQNEISLNIARLLRIARLSGIDYLSIGSYSGDESSTQPEITGFTNNGSAIAGLKSSKQLADPARFINANLDRYNKPYSESRWSKSKIDLNISEINRNIMNEASKNKSVRDPKIWSQELDFALKKGLSDATSENLLNNVSKSSKIYGIISCLAVAFACKNNFSLDNVVTNLIEIQGLANFDRIVLAKIFPQYDPKTKTRISAIPAYQLDRLILVKSLLKIKPLISSDNKK